jgi:hypothetical protein
MPLRRGPAVTRISPRPAHAAYSCAAIAALSLLAVSAGEAQLQFPIRLQSGESWPARGPVGTIEIAGPKPAILFAGDVVGARIGPVHIVGAYRAIETARNANVSDLIVDGLRGEVLRECFRIRGKTIVVRNSYCTQYGGARTRLGDLPEGLHVESGSNILVENSRFDGFQYVKEPTRYWNGDGIAAERDVDGLIIRNVTANDNTDAGFDIKPPVTMDGVSAEGNCRNYRFWSDARVGTLTLGGTVHRGGTSPCSGIWIKGDDDKPALIEISRLRVRTFGQSPLLVVEHGRAMVRIVKCELATKAQLVAYVQNREDLRLGSGCRHIEVRTGLPPSERRPS